MATEASVFATAFLLAPCYRLGDDGSLAALVQLSETADDLFAATVLNLAVELAAAENARDLKNLISPVARCRPSLRPEVESLMARLDAVYRTCFNTRSSGNASIRASESAHVLSGSMLDAQRV